MTDITDAGFSLLGFINSTLQLCGLALNSASRAQLLMQLTKEAINFLKLVLQRLFLRSLHRQQHYDSTIILALNPAFRALLLMQLTKEAIKVPDTGLTENKTPSQKGTLNREQKKCLSENT